MSVDNDGQFDLLAASVLVLVSNKSDKLSGSLL